jgi:osmotically-inducible protein OsmY
VHGHDGLAGTVLQTMVPQDVPGEGRARAVCRLTGRRRAVAVPWEWVVGAAPGLLELDAGQEQLERLPEVRGDAELRRAVVDALRRDSLVGQVDSPAFRVEVEEGAVTLSGHLDSRPAVRRAEATVRLVPGVLSLLNLVVADDDLEATVARWLADDPRTGPFPVEVYVHSGIVELAGTVDSAEVRAAAEEVAARAPARAVLVGLEVPGAPSARLPLLLPRPGIPVYATDGRVGCLSQVVIDPGTRRVVAFLVAPAQRVGLIPTDLIGQVTDAVLLRADRATLAALPEPPPGALGPPPPGWRPPVDYRTGEVLFSTASPGGGGIASSGRAAGARGAPGGQRASSSADGAGGGPGGGAERRAGP